MMSGIGAPLLHCHVHENPDYPGVWDVVAIACYGSGRVPHIQAWIFTGPGARERAHAFALTREACALTSEEQERWKA